MHLIDGQADHPNISDAETFWRKLSGPSFTRLREGSIAVVGGGDSAASVVFALLENIPKTVTIDVFCTRGMLVSRDERPWDLKLWMDPVAWRDFPGDVRREYIRRTQREVCSEVFMSRIVQARNVSILPGKVTQACMQGKQVRIKIKDHTGQTVTRIYKRLVVATGFRRWSFQDLFADQGMFPFQAAWGVDWERRKEEEMAEHVRTYQPRIQPGLRKAQVVRPPARGADLWTRLCEPGVAGHHGGKNH